MLPPGPKKSLRTTTRWLRGPDDLLQDGYKEYGDIWTFQMQGGITFVFINDPQLVKQVSEGDPKVLHGGDAYAQMATALLGDHSLLTMDEQPHDDQRKLIRPSFHADHIGRFREHVVAACERSLETWPLHTPMPVLTRMQEITLDTIMSAVFGVTGSMMERLAAQVRATVEYGANDFRMLMIQVYRLRDRTPRSFARIIEGLNKLVYEVIATARRDPKLEERGDVLAMLLRTEHADGSPMTDTEIRDQLVTLLMQGHQSTGTALSWSIERLTRNPRVLERLQEEVRGGDESYVDAVIREVFRIRPTVPLFLRMVKQPYEIGGYVVEPGMSLSPCNFVIHRRADIYPDPLEFRPERFLGYEEDPYTWFPFGGAPRSCLGRSLATLEMQAVLHTLALRARFDPTRDPDEGIQRRGVMFSPKEGGRAVLRELVAGEAQLVAH